MEKYYLEFAARYTETTEIRDGKGGAAYKQHIDFIGQTGAESHRRFSYESMMGSCDVFPFEGGGYECLQFDVGMVDKNSNQFAGFW